ncbi:hypothetical protein [uncultured Nostoc sp.]|uniref:hypothetical protein n=1 Tax=uncultured Nostoc sp. TaxID=340711 RepID=UPI0035C9B9B2
MHDNMKCDRTHSCTTGDRFIFEVFYKAIPSVSFANALTLSQQAIALFLSVSARRCLRRATPTHSLFHNGRCLRRAAPTLF